MDSHDTFAMKIVCAWCGAILQDGHSNGQRSHGICVSCAVKFEVEAISLEVMSLVWSEAQCGACLTKRELLSGAYSRGKGCAFCRTTPRLARHP